MREHCRWWPIWSLLLIIIGASSASATIVHSFSLSALSLASHSIIRGEVVAEECVYDPHWEGIYTHTTLRVVEVLSGSEKPGDFIIVRQIGGSLDGIESQVVGTTTFLPGAEVLIFGRSDGAFHYLVGMGQGAWNVERKTGQLPQLRRDLGKLTAVPPAGPAQPQAPDALTLPALREAVTRALQGVQR